MAEDKTQKIIEAARERNKLEQENTAKPATKQPIDYDDPAVQQKIEAAEEQAAIKVQPRAVTMTGDIDVEAMGDVKGDGGDAKNYPDGDPDKALGVPVFEHGLNETPSPLTERRQSKRTQAELDRGREAVNARQNARVDETSNRRDGESDVESTVLDGTTKRSTKSAEKKTADKTAENNAKK